MGRRNPGRGFLYCGLEGRMQCHYILLCVTGQTTDIMTHSGLRVYVRYMCCGLSGLMVSKVTTVDL